MKMRDGRTRELFRTDIFFLIFLTVGSVVCVNSLVEAMELGDVSSWGYQLQNADPVELVSSEYDLLVIDYSRDGTDEGAYTFEEIQYIRNAGKMVLCYISIGEAEDYRFYWQEGWRPGNPVWLGPENPDWPGNYKVIYSHEGWWETAIQPYLDRILSAGFDGIYMDIIDAYWFWHDEYGIPEKYSAGKMIELVERIGQYTRTFEPSFILCPQNGSSIIDDTSRETALDYLDTVDAIGVEDLFYNTTVADREYRLFLLNFFSLTGNKVFNVEYINPGSWDEYRGEAAAVPFEIIPYGAAPDRELDELTGFMP